MSDWIHFNIGKYQFRIHKSDKSWFGIFYPLKSGMYMDIMIGFWFFRKRIIPF